MSKPSRQKPDRHYSFRRLNIVFAFSAFALLLITLWMVFEDYAKLMIKRYRSIYYQRKTDYT